MKGFLGLLGDIGLFFRDLIKRKWFEFLSRRRFVRMAKAKRPWRAISPYGQIDLGIVDLAEAKESSSHFGQRVSYIDYEYGIIFYDTNLGPAGGIE